MTPECLQVERLNKHFGGLQAIRDLNLCLRSGERRAILGPNGAGKTTLFNLISGTMLPSSGRISIFGKDVLGLAPHRRTALGLTRTFQITNLFPKLSLLENVLLAVQSMRIPKAPTPRAISTYGKVERRAYELLEEWGLLAKAKEQISNLSYGEQRQVDLILALASKPKMLLLDEPTAGLSPAETTAVTEVIRKLDANMTILLIEHDMDVAFGLADYVTVLHMGSVFAEGKVEEIKKDPRAQEIYLGNE